MSIMPPTAIVEKVGGGIEGDESSKRKRKGSNSVFSAVDVLLSLGSQKSDEEDEDDDLSESSDAKEKKKKTCVKKEKKPTVAPKKSNGNTDPKNNDNDSNNEKKTSSPSSLATSPSPSKKLKTDTSPNTPHQPAPKDTDVVKKESSPIVTDAEAQQPKKNSPSPSPSPSSSSPPPQPSIPLDQTQKGQYSKQSSPPPPPPLLSQAKQQQANQQQLQQQQQLAVQQFLLQQQQHHHQHQLPQHQRHPQQQLLQRGDSKAPLSQIQLLPQSQMPPHQMQTHRDQPGQQQYVLYDQSRQPPNGSQQYHQMLSHHTTGPELMSHVNHTGNGHGHLQFIGPDGRPMTTDQQQQQQQQPYPFQLHAGMRHYGHPSIQYSSNSGARPVSMLQQQQQQQQQKHTFRKMARGDESPSDDGGALPASPKYSPTPIAPSSAKVGGVESDPKYAELLDMSTTEFNRYLKMCALEADQILELRKARRRKKNRLYAKRSRGKKLQKLLEMNAKCNLLQAKVSHLTSSEVA